LSKIATEVVKKANTRTTLAALVRALSKDYLTRPRICVRNLAPANYFVSVVYVKTLFILCRPFRGTLTRTGLAAIARWVGIGTAFLQPAYRSARYLWV